MTEKNQDAVGLGRLGGLARNRWTPEERSAQARKAAQARWEQKRKQTDTK